MTFALLGPISSLGCIGAAEARAHVNELVRQQQQQQLLAYQTLIYVGRRQERQDFELFSGEYFARQIEAESRGLELLRANLSPAQLAMYEALGYFEVIGSSSGKTYRIERGQVLNISELDAKGHKVATLCFAPSGSICTSDCMLAQKLALECDEPTALRVANRSEPRDRTFTSTPTFTGSPAESL